MTPREAKEINQLLVEEINTGLRDKFKDPRKDSGKVYRYPLPFDWMPLASVIKDKYRDAGWTVSVAIEISCDRTAERDCVLEFRPAPSKTRMR